MWVGRGGVGLRKKRSVAFAPPERSRLNLDSSDEEEEMWRAPSPFPGKGRKDTSGRGGRLGKVKRGLRKIKGWVRRLWK